MTRMPTLLLGAVALVAALAACAGPSGGDTFTPAPIAAETSTLTTTPTPTPTPTAVAAAPSIPGPQLPAIDPAGFMTGQGGPGVEFDSPSGNIHCGIYTYPSGPFYGCSIGDYHYADPDPDGTKAGCEEQINYGGGFYANLDDAGSVHVLCRGGAMFGGEIGGVGTLPYGTSVSYADVVCESYEDHMGCRSLVTGHGFTLARGEYSIF